MEYKVIHSEFLDDGGIQSIAIDATGDGYTTAPEVVITPTNGGTGATAISVVDDGGVVAVIVTNPGKGYKTAPTISFIGTGSNATAIVTLNDLVSRVKVYTTDGWSPAGEIAIAKHHGILTYYQAIKK